MRAPRWRRPAKWSPPVSGHDRVSRFHRRGTEADNLAITGVQSRRGGTVVCLSPSTTPCCTRATRSTDEWHRSGPTGIVDLDALAGVLDDDVSVVSVMLARRHQFCDAVAALGRRLRGTTDTRYVVVEHAGQRRRGRRCRRPDRCHSSSSGARRAARRGAQRKGTRRCLPVVTARP